MRLGMAEFLVVLIVALLVLGPEQLPRYAQKLGIALREFKKISAEATKEIRENITEPLAEAQRPIREAMEPISDLTEEVNDNMKDIKKSFTDLGKPPREDHPPRQAAPEEADAAGETEVPAADGEGAAAAEPMPQEP